MGAASRTKGQTGERELAALLADLTGQDVRRRVRNHAGDDDLAGVPGWSIECKRYRATTPALVSDWWLQAQRQAQAAGCEPVLLYRADRGQWRAVWRAHLLAAPGASLPPGASVEACPATWWALCGAAVHGAGVPHPRGIGSSEQALVTGNSNPVHSLVKQKPQKVNRP